MPQPLDGGLEKCLIGYLDHETGHVAFSYFGVAEPFAKKHPGCEGLLNVIEDALIERRAIKNGRLGGWPLRKKGMLAMWR